MRSLLLLLPPFLVATTATQAQHAVDGRVTDAESDVTMPGEHNDAVLRGSALNRFGARISLDQTISDDVRLRIRATGSRLDSDNASTGDNSGGVEKFNSLLPDGMAQKANFTVQNYTGEGFLSL